MPAASSGFGTEGLRRRMPEVSVVSVSDFGTEPFGKFEVGSCTPASRRRLRFARRSFRIVGIRERPFVADRVVCGMPQCFPDRGIVPETGFRRGLPFAGFRLPAGSGRPRIRSSPYRRERNAQALRGVSPLPLAESPHVPSAGAFPERDGMYSGQFLRNANRVTGGIRFFPYACLEERFCRGKRGIRPMFALFFRRSRKTVFGVTKGFCPTFPVLFHRNMFRIFVPKDRQCRREPGSTDFRCSSRRI